MQVTTTLSYRCCCLIFKTVGRWELLLLQIRLRLTTPPNSSLERRRIVLLLRWDLRIPQMVLHQLRMIQLEQNRYY